MTRHSLIDEARRHQRRRRQMIGAIMVTPIAIGGSIVGLNLGGAGSQGGEVAAHSGPPPSTRHTPQAVRKNSPTTESPTNVVVLSPITGDVIAASTSEASAAALQAVRSTVAAQSEKAAGSGQLEQMAQAAESAQAAAAAAAAQSGHH